ncbi:MAG TPA: glycosyltransferase family 87 protein [Streptosporangiaceae bacterium]|nr:glycosyltransferase family 87 protein [Streptosporangiaceae bacterium]
MTLPLTRPPKDGGRDPGALESLAAGTARWWGWLGQEWLALRDDLLPSPSAGAEPGTGGRQRPERGAGRRTVAGALAACALFAAAVAVISTDHPQHLWGVLAAGTYALAALAVLGWRRHGLRLALPISAAGAVLVPLCWLAATGSGQPEVTVVMHSAWLFLHHGTPYHAAAAIAASNSPNVYNPYLPALAVFGLPHALFGTGILTDPRIWFGLVFIAAFGAALRIGSVPHPWLWTAVVTASPIIAYPLSTGGDDLPVLAMMCLGLALLRPAQTRTWSRIAAAGLVLGLAAAMKATAWPALAVAGALLAVRDGWRTATALVITALGVAALADGPVLVAQPGSVAANTILFPLGLTKIKSPAASLLPGHLIAQTWTWGHYAAIGLVLLAALSVAASLLLRPPRDVHAAGWRLVIGLVLMFAFAPASRFGYVVYPLGLSALLLLTMPNRVTSRAASPAPPADAGDSNEREDADDRKESPHAGRIFDHPAWRR